jgi:hypothetical protein
MKYFFMMIQSLVQLSNFNLSVAKLDHFVDKNKK